jgi:hypothetical protein
MDGEPNFRFMERSRGRPRPGDVFAMQVPDSRYLFGRVIFADPPRGMAPWPGANLVYIYRHVAATAEPVPIQQLRPDSLLIPPAFTNNLGWVRGYYKTIASTQLTDADLLVQHCFKDGRLGFVDERGVPLAERVEPCGTWGLVSYRWIDDRVSDALGIPRAPATND